MLELPFTSTGPVDNRFSGAGIFSGVLAGDVPVLAAFGVLTGLGVNILVETRDGASDPTSATVMTGSSSGWPLLAPLLVALPLLPVSPASNLSFDIFAESFDIVKLSLFSPLWLLGRLRRSVRLLRLLPTDPSQLVLPSSAGVGGAVEVVLIEPAADGVAVPAEVDASLNATEERRPGSKLVRPRCGSEVRSTVLCVAVLVVLAGVGPVASKSLTSVVGASAITDFEVLVDSVKGFPSVDPPEGVVTSISDEGSDGMVLAVEGAVSGGERSVRLLSLLLGLLAGCIVPVAIGGGSDFASAFASAYVGGTSSPVGCT